MSACASLRSQATDGKEIKVCVQDPSTTKDKKLFWIGTTAMIVGILSYIPSVISLCVVDDKEGALYFSLPIYVVALISNCFWLPYGIGVVSVPLIISASITIFLLIVLIIIVVVVGTMSTNDPSIDATDGATQT